jgi:hypothetical protein
MSKNYNYQQGVITATDHSIFKQGQIVDVIREEDSFYIVQTGKTGSMERVEKKDLSFD